MVATEIFSEDGEDGEAEVHIDVEYDEDHIGNVSLCVYIFFSISKRIAAKQAISNQGY